MSNNNRQVDNNPQKKAKKIFILLLITSILMVAGVVVGLVFSFIYIKKLELYQSLITGGAMLYLIPWAVATVIWYKKAFQEDIN